MTDADDVSSAPLVAIQVNVTPDVSWSTLVAAQPLDEVTPDSGSATDQVTVGRDLFQPAAFGGGVTSAVTTGGVMSTGVSGFGRTVTVTVSSAVFPFPSSTVRATTCTPTGRVSCVVAPLAKTFGPAHVKLSSSPSGSVDAKPSSVTTALPLAAASSV